MCQCKIALFLTHGAKPRTVLVNFGAGVVGLPGFSLNLAHNQRPHLRLLLHSNPYVNTIAPVETDCKVNRTEYRLARFAEFSETLQLRRF